MKKKVNLDVLKVKSFVTTAEKFDPNTIKGGSWIINCGPKPDNKDVCDEHNSFCTGCGC